MILFIDDEPRRVEPYVEELKFAGYEKIELKDNLGKAIDFFQEHQQEINLVILDIMIPLPNSFDRIAVEETQFGLNTGIYFYNKYLQKVPIPVILWTNSYDAELPDSILNNQVHLIRKIDFLPHEFVKKVKEILNQEKILQN